MVQEEVEGGVFTMSSTRPFVLAIALALLWSELPVVGLRGSSVEVKLVRDGGCRLPIGEVVW